MNLLGALFRTSVGKKYVMAVTGLLLFGFVIVHMAGNLQIFLGPGPINSYAEMLKSKPALLWAARLGLLLTVILHLVAATMLVIENRRARGVGYSTGKPVASSFAARTIAITGIVILAFIIYHLSHFTVGLVDPQYLQLRDAEGRHDVYRMMVAGFSHPIVSAFYIFATGLLCLHLSHGVTSLFQSLGLRSHKTLGLLNRIASVAAILIFLGNSAIPLAILAGLIR
jgi:succinate dehydrogenase / fumarate reductase cytochrome b subunit